MPFSTSKQRLHKLDLIIRHSKNILQPIGNSKKHIEPRFYQLYVSFAFSTLLLSLSARRTRSPSFDIGQLLARSAAKWKANSARLSVLSRELSHDFPGARCLREENKLGDTKWASRQRVREEISQNHAKRWSLGLWVKRKPPLGQSTNEKLFSDISWKARASESSHVRRLGISHKLLILFIHKRKPHASEMFSLWLRERERREAAAYYLTHQL